MNIPGVEFMRREDKIIETYSLIWNSVELLPPSEAIQDNSIWTAEEIVCRERMTTADNTPVQFLGITFVASVRGLWTNSNNIMVQAMNKSYQTLTT